MTPTREEAAGWIKEDAQKVRDLESERQENERQEQMRAAMHEELIGVYTTCSELASGYLYALSQEGEIPREREEKLYSQIEEGKELGGLHLTSWEIRKKKVGLLGSRKTAFTGRVIFTAPTQVFLAQFPAACAYLGKNNHLGRVDLGSILDNGTEKIDCELSVWNRNNQETVTVSIAKTFPKGTKEGDKLEKAYEQQKKWNERKIRFF